MALFLIFRRKGLKARQNHSRNIGIDGAMQNYLAAVQLIEICMATAAFTNIGDNARDCAQGLRNGIILLCDSRSEGTAKFHAGPHGTESVFALVLPLNDPYPAALAYRN